MAVLGYLLEASDLRACRLICGEGVPLDDRLLTRAFLLLGIAVGIWIMLATSVVSTKLDHGTCTLQQR